MPKFRNIPSVNKDGRKFQTYKQMFTITVIENHNDI